MDPASAVIGVVSGSATIVAASVKTIQFLTSLQDSYKRTELVIWDLRSTCQAFETAWSQIHLWASEQTSREVAAGSIFEQLLAYLEVSKIIFSSLQNDLERLEKSLKPSWRLSPKSRARILIHEKQFNDHCGRLHRQISSLNLLLSTARLPVSSVQNAVLDLLQPVFRKDEESAWTIVKTRQSTRAPSASIFSRSTRNQIPVEDAGQDGGRRFAFENDLFSGPVYKRILMMTLTTVSKIGEEPLDILEEESGRNNKQSSTENATSSPDAIDFTHESILRTLGGVGFSVGVQSDLHSIENSPSPYTLAKRSLPLGPTLKRHQMLPEELNFVNAKLILGVTKDDASLVAQALDDGADINFISDLQGSTPLKISLEGSRLSKIPALLMLYHETDVQFRNKRGETLVHHAVQTANVGILRRLVTRADDLRTYDGNGRTPLHIAAADQSKGLYSLKEINRIFTGKHVYPDTILDRGGQSALHVAVRNNNAEHAVELLKLGCDPSFFSEHKASAGHDSHSAWSPLYTAVVFDFEKLVRTMLEECSDKLDLVNWEHSHQLTLLQCAREHTRCEIGEILVAHGADWSWNWKEADKILEFSNSGSTPTMLLTLISQGCLPMQLSLDITRSVQKMLETCTKDLAVKVLKTFLLSDNGNEGPQRPRIYARLGPLNNPDSGFTETLSLHDVLAKIIFQEKEQKDPSSLALSDKAPSKEDRATDVTLRAHTLKNHKLLGAFLYQYDKANHPLASVRDQHTANVHHLSNAVLSGKQIEAGYSDSHLVYGTRLKAHITRVEYGTFYGKPAVLVVIKCNFDSSYADKRDYLRASAISVKLSPSISTDKTPRILAYAPELVHGSLSTVQKKSEWETAATVGFSGHDETVQTRLSNKTIVAKVQGNMGGVQNERIFWRAEETPMSPEGVRTVPSLLQVAFIVEHEQGKRFTARFFLEADRNLFAQNGSHKGKHYYFTFDPSKPRLPQGMTPFGPDFGKNLLKLHKLTAVSGPS